MLSLDESIDFLNKSLDLPSIRSLSRILQQCRAQRDLRCAKRLHTQVCNYGLDEQKVIGNYLVPMFVDCGSPSDSLQLFQKLPERNEFSWTSLLHSFMESGEARFAFSLFEQMQSENVKPSKFTFPVLINACANPVYEKRGRDIHNDIIVEEYEGDLFVGNALVDMYAKWGALEEAREILDEMPERDKVSWTALITGHIENGFLSEALAILKQMKLEGVPPDEVTYASCIRACSVAGSIAYGQELHAEIALEGLEKEAFVGNTLVDMYASCGLLAEAQLLFDELPAKTAVTWTSLIDGYVENGHQDKALKCISEMQSKGVTADAITYVCSLKACGDFGSLELGKRIHAEVSAEGFNIDPIIGSTLVDMYAKCGLMMDARDVFNELSIQDVVSWTALIAGYVEHELNVEALNAFKEMQMVGVNPNFVTYLCCLKACSNLEAAIDGQVIHAEVVKLGIETDCFVSNTLVDLYAKCGLFLDAQYIFDELAVQDVVSLNAMISGIAEKGDGKEALMLYMRMLDEGIPPNNVTFSNILKACGNMQALDMGKRVHAQICSSRNLDDIDMIMSIALIDMYGKCGNTLDAKFVFDGLPVKGLMHWTALITGYARQGESEYVSYLLNRMKEEAVEPNEVTFLNILTACTHAGLVNEGLKYFQSMSRDYGITPSTKHYNCMVDLFSRVGQLHEAIEMLQMMQPEPCLPALSTVLGACCKWGNVDLAVRVFGAVVKSNRNNASLFTLMSNIYSDGETWEDNENLQEIQSIIRSSSNQMTLQSTFTSPTFIR